MEDLLLWRDPKKTGIVFGAVTLATILLVLTNFNLIPIVAYALLTAVLGAFAWNNIASFTHRCDNSVQSVNMFAALHRSFFSPWIDACDADLLSFISLQTRRSRACAVEGGRV